MVLRALPTGSLDPDFGDGGRVFLPALQGKPGAVFVNSLQLDGDRILLGGASLDEAFVMRLAPDGQPDSTFDGDGHALLPGANAIAGPHVEPDDTIFVIGSRTAGSTPSGFASRLTTNGAPDPGFGERMFASGTEFFRTAFTDDGRVFVVGGDSPPAQPLFRIWQ